MVPLSNATAPFECPLSICTTKSTTIDLPIPRAASLPRPHSGECDSEKQPLTNPIVDRNWIAWSWCAYYIHHMASIRVVRSVAIDAIDFSSGKLVGDQCMFCVTFLKSIVSTDILTHWPASSTHEDRTS